MYGQPPKPSRGRPGRGPGAADGDAIRVAARVTGAEKEHLLTYLLRVPAVFENARSPGGEADRPHYLMPADFGESHEVGLGVVWACALEYYGRYGRMIGVDALEVEADGRLRDRSDVIPEIHADTLDLIRVAFAVDVSTFDVRYGMDLLAKFAHERTVADPLRRFWARIGDHTPADIPAVLEQFGRRIERIKVTNYQAPTGIMEIKNRSTQVDPTPTGFPPMDRTMGGRRPGQLIGLYGPTGGGKTRLACMLTAEAAIREALRAGRAGELPKNVIYLSAEAPAEEIRWRLFSYLARVPMARLRDANWPDTIPGRLSSVVQGFPLQPYESAGDVQGGAARTRSPDDAGGIAAADLPPLLGELERLAEVQDLICHNLHILELFGTEEDPHGGTGGVPELQAKINRIVQRSGRGVEFIVVDFVQDFCKRELMGKGLNEKDHLRYYVDRFSPSLRDMIVMPHNCSALLLYQLNGEANAKSASHVPSFADAGECKTTATNLSFTFQLGTKDKAHSRVILHEGKTRGVKGSDKPATILRFRESYEDLYEDGEYRLIGGTMVHHNSAAYASVDATAAAAAAGPVVDVPAYTGDAPPAADATTPGGRRPPAGNFARPAGRLPNVRDGV